MSGGLIVPNDLVGWWCPSIDATGGILLDRSGRNNHGTLTNMDPASDWVVSGGKGALDFDGSNDYVDLGNNPSLTNANGTLSFWFGNKGTNKVASIFSRNINADVWPVFSVGYEGSRMFLSSNAGASGEPGTTILAYSAVNNGDHIVVSWAGLVASCYQNARLVATITRTNGFGNNPSSRTVIGRSGEFNNYYFDGQIDDVRIYNRALTAGEVSELYNVGRGNMPLRRRRRYAGQAAGFKAYWARRQSQLIGGGV
jgi:hypothetical protein